MKSVFFGSILQVSILLKILRMNFKFRNNEKVNFLSFCLTILSLALFTSCEVNENNELVKNQLNEKQIVINEQAYVNLEKEFSKIRESLNNNSSSSDSEYAAAFFDIKLIDGEFAVSEVVYLTASEYGLAQGLSDRFNDQNTIQFELQKVVHL